VEAPRAPLTVVERKLWHYLIDFLAEHTFQPSVREIARHFRIPSTKTVADLLASLEAKNYIRRTPGRSRGVVLEGFASGSGTQPVPVVRAGPDRVLIVEEYLTLDRSFLPGEDAYLIRALIEDAPAHAIREGDLLLVHPSARAQDDATVVARVGGAVLARTLERRGAAIVLRGPSPDADDVEVGPGDDFEILGPLCGVFRLAAPRRDGDDGGEGDG